MVYKVSYITREKERWYNNYGEKLEWFEKITELKKI